MNDIARIIENSPPAMCTSDNSGDLSNIIENLLPYITYNLTNHSNASYRCIRVNGVAIHRIENADTFYNYFGYTEDLRKAGVLPEEFIWCEYTNNRQYDFTVCRQVQIIEYLRAHSLKFIEQYGKHSEEWLATLKKMRTTRDDVCGGCKIKTFCSN